MYFNVVIIIIIIIIIFIVWISIMFLIFSGKLCDLLLSCYLHSVQV